MSSSDTSTASVVFITATPSPPKNVSSGSYFAHGGAAAQPLHILEETYAWPAPANAQEDVTLERKDTRIKQLTFLTSAELPTLPPRRTH